MKREILADCALALVDSRIDCAKCLLNARKALGRDALRSEGSHFHFKGQPELHNLQYVLDGTQPFWVYAVGHTTCICGHEHAGTLTRRKQSFGAQGRDRLTHDCPAYPHRGHEILFGGEARTRLEPTAADLRRNARNHLGCQSATDWQWVQEAGLASCARSL